MKIVSRMILDEVTDFFGGEVSGTERFKGVRVNMACERLCRFSGAVVSFVKSKDGFGSDVESSDGQHHALPIYDINTAGLGFVFNPSHVHISADETLSAILTVPGLDPFPIRAEVRNLRPLPGDRKHKIAGCRFEGMAPEDHATLATLLARLD